MTRLCVIPARGGSKRIPGKNVRVFRGRPILAWAIQAAVDSGLFDAIMVSTDDEAVADVARAAGAQIPFMRRPETADDQAGLMAVLAEVTGDYAATGQAFDAVCCLLATAPLVTADRLRAGCDLLEGGAEVVVPVAPFDAPIQRALRMDASGEVAMMDPAQVQTRSQDLETAWRDVGQFYWMRWPVAREGRAILAGGAVGLPISPLETQDIDTEDDWALCELKFDRLRATGRL